MRDRPLGTWLCGAGLLAAFVLGGCATSVRAPVTEAGIAAAPPSGDAPGIERALYEQLDRWRGTRYRLGGMSRQGIDCSGLTYVVYRELFDARLPRTAEEQGKIGLAVPRDELKPGDLVFFQTGWSREHVGIYVENGLFLHASRSSGVRLSSLASGYWSERFWKARRPEVTGAAT